MSKKSTYGDGATARDKKAFAPYLSEDEELIVATGYGKNYLRQRGIYFIMLPGGVFWGLGIAFMYFGKGDLALGLLYGMFVSFVFAFLKALLLYHSHRYILTTRRVIIKHGFFSVKLMSALYDKITHIEVEQSFYDRMVMKHGTVIVHTAGSNKDEMQIANIDGPIEFKNLLERLINREREHIGRQTGPVVAVEGELVEEE